jgi:putative hydrolase of the HAD superfamily
LSGAANQVGIGHIREDSFLFPGRRRIRAVLFDLDDTLIDWSGLTADYPVFMRPHLENVYDYLSEQGHPLPDCDAFCECYLNTVIDHWREAKKTWNAVNFGRVLVDFCTTLGLDVSQIDFQGVMCAYDAKPIPDVVLFADTIPVLKALRHQDYKIGLVTNSMLPMWMRDVELQAYEIIDYFDMRITSGDTGFIKPHPFIYQKALELLDVAPNEAVFVGDRPDYDIAGANDAGLTSVLMSPPYLERELNNIHPDHIITCLSQLLPVLKQLEGVNMS